MDVFERIYRMARSHLGSDKVNWNDAGGSAGPPPSDREPRRPPTPQGDPRLAGYYANLEVPYGSDLETIRSAWKKLLKKYHPDLHGRDPEKKRIANELTAELTQAYQELEKALTEGKSR
jgi:DnaJ-domain-containing protein 1